MAYSQRAFLPLSDSQINLFEHKLALLKMKQGEDPHIFFSQLKEILGVLLMLEVKKDDREICSIMLKVLLANTAVCVRTWLYISLVTKR